MDNFLFGNQVRKALAYASGTADRNGIVIDTAGAEEVTFIVTFATIAAGAVTSVKVQQGAASNMSDAADLEGTGISVAADDDDQVFMIDIVKPLERYLRVVIDKDASNATAESAVAVLSGRRKKPCDNNITDETTSEIHISPAEGTA
jgi:hypothetical protein